MIKNSILRCPFGKTFVFKSRKAIARRQYYTVRNTPTPSIAGFACVTLFGFVSVAQAEPLKSISKNKTESQETVQSVITQSDELFSLGKFKECFQILKPYKDSNDIEILWRIARVLYNMSKQKGLSKSENASLIKEAYSYIDKAMSLKTDHYAIHKWMAILYDAKSALDGLKSRINALPVFKQHLMTAIELNPKDATSIYMLGQYMYNIADMSHLQRVIAKTLFGTPPEATFEEAFYYFSRAEEVEPNFYSANLLMLGKTCLKLKRIEAAHYWLKCATAYPVRTDEDEAVRIEAEELLKKNPEVKKKEKEYEVKQVQ